MRNVRIGVSSGLDSRFVLAALLEVLPSSNIYAYTFGNVGNKDYENAPRMLAPFLENYELINNLSKEFSPTESNPFRVVSKREHIILKGSVVDTDCVSFTGRLGDALAGGHLKTEVAVPYEDAIRGFIKQFSKNKIFENGWLHHSYEPSFSLPRKPLLDGNIMDFDMQLDLLFRQHQSITLKPELVDDININLLSKKQRGKVSHLQKKWFNPFSDERWQKSFLSAPRKLLFEKKLYMMIMKEQFSQLYPDLLGEYNFIFKDGPTNVDWIYIWNSSMTFREGVLKTIDSVNSKGGWFDKKLIETRMDAGDRFVANTVKRLFKLNSYLEDAGYV